MSTERITPEPTTIDEETDATGAGVIHEYDGIEECDNRLPRWWLATFYGAIFFAGVYWVGYHTFGIGVLPNEAFADAQAVRIAAEAERIKAAGEVTPEMMVTLAKDAGTVAQGKQTFEQICATCHGPNGEGKIGPNLTDDHWLHSSEPMAIYTIVRDGFLPKQMPAWGKMLGEEKVRSAAAYVLTLKGKNLPGKAPEGELAE